jgi:hypothetical protein
MIDAALLSQQERPVLPAVARAYAESVAEGHNTVGTRLTVFRDAVLLVIIGPAVQLGVWLSTMRGLSVAAVTGPDPESHLGPRWGRRRPEHHGQPRPMAVSRSRRSAAVSERLPRSPDHPDCLSHGGSRLCPRFETTRSSGG